MALDETGTHRRDPNYSRVVELMEIVYGKFNDVPRPHLWIPPPMKAGGHKGRYLWTDAFGVMNFLTLYKESGRERYLTLAMRLIEAVHDILGSDRTGEFRLPRATEDEPLAGGLRIGKVDEEGPDSDGQYLHYLTLWMFALNRTTVASKDPQWNEMAMRLALAVCPWFWRDAQDHRKGTFWKISWDMYTPLTQSEGYLDPLDSFLVLSHLQATADAYGTDLSLENLIDDFAWLARNRHISKHGRDPLDLGMGLWIAHWLARFEDWALNILKYNSKNMLYVMSDENLGRLQYSSRSAFREMGACLGIKTIDQSLLREHDRKAKLLSLARRDILHWEMRLNTRVTEDTKTITLNMMASAYIPGGMQIAHFI
ncbi:hypothetical protein KEM54_004716 [Ascosphaera aggregata]|nr:hypothetical protein KEM54_004716 [Ascosphaera aggregata]